jgi:hypothetical protein
MINSSCGWMTISVATSQNWKKKNLVHTSLLTPAMNFWFAKKNKTIQFED